MQSWDVEPPYCPDCAGWKKNAKELQAELAAAREEVKRLKGERDEANKWVVVAGQDMSGLHRERVRMEGEIQRLEAVAEAAGKCDDSVVNPDTGERHWHDIVGVPVVWIHRTLWEQVIDALATLKEKG